MSFLPNIHLFASALRAAGLPVANSQIQDAARGLALVDVGVRAQVYHALRSLLVTHAAHLRLFDALFSQFFGSIELREWAQQKMPRAPRHKEPDRPFDVTNYMAYKARRFDEEIEVGDKSQTFSQAEALNTKDFAQMTADEIDTLRAVMQGMTWRIVQRATRRKVEHRNGDALHLRGVLRRAARTAGVPLALAWQRRKIKQRPLVLIADISGSMEKYSRVLLMFFHCVAQRLQTSNTFVFGTRLTNITPALKLKNLDLALDEAARETVDWSGGTRIGASLREFNRRWSRRVLRRGALAIIISDGWERGDVTMLKREMRFLRHRAHRVIWLNPLSGKQGYAPEVEGMRAALPYVDDFLPIHNLHSLKEVNAHLAALA